MSSVMWKNKLLGSSGFTLLELVLATLISALVLAIFSVSIGFALRVWERQQQQKPSDMPALIDLLKWQMACFDPAPIRFEGETRPLFQGNQHSLAIATDHSVKAISRGAPVVARYVYSEKDKKLYYAEMPFDPYHPDRIVEFLEMKPSDDEKSWPRFYPTDAEQFSLSYGGEDDNGFEEAWQDEEEPPMLVMVKWSPMSDAPVFVDLIIPNFFFPREEAEEDASPLQRRPGR